MRRIVLPPRWRRSWMGLLVAILVSAWVILERSGWPSNSAPTEVTNPGAYNGDDTQRYHDQTFRVIHVIDGDTLDIDTPDAATGKPKTRIRLWGVDTPEVAHDGQSAMFFGPEAMEFARQTLENQNVRVVLSTRQTRDKFNRLLAYVIVGPDGEMFNEMLIESGFGYADSRFDHHYESRFAHAESRARDQQSGLWKNVRVDDMPKWRQKKERPRHVPRP